MKYLAIILHFLFNSYKVVFKSNIEKLEEIKMVPITIASRKQPESTPLTYLQAGSIFYFMEPQTIILDYREAAKLIPTIMICQKYLLVANFIILPGPAYQNIYKEKYYYQTMLPKTNVFFLPSPYDKIFRANFNIDTRFRCKIIIYSKIENILLILFYLILAISMILLYVIFRLWLGINAEKDPVCTITELAMCPTMLFRDVKTKCMESCLICMEHFENKDIVRVLTCEHYYHTQCVDVWLETMSARCPYCRRLMKMDV